GDHPRERVVLPPGAKFTCHQCGDCCRSFPVSLSDAEKERFARRDWSDVLPGHSGAVFDVVSRGAGKSASLLKRRRDGACVFLAATKFLDLFAKSAFGHVKDDKRREFVEILAQGVREQVKKGILRPPAKEPSFPERLLFRQLVGMAVRREAPGLATPGVLRRS